MKQELMSWIDIETTTLDEREGIILEVDIKVTDNELNVIDELGGLAIHINPSALNTCNPWALEQHTKSGLIGRCYSSATDATAVEELAVEFMQKHFPGDPPPMAGNSVHFDRLWIREQMPDLFKCFSHRNIDVSAFKEYFKVRGLGCFDDVDEGKNYPKPHDASGDINRSIAELKYYTNYLDIPVNITNF